ncbi:MAG: hypothetical protein A3A73_00450 [Omnitrophica bacterium RIFCSPLOWO2_01_FULL_50_24]|nr:MAG: hypothetical protein A3A73_00450 [Omnitrophica bacterium RIFCSPLOWO2_01_FULL_50_24]
MSPNVLSYFAHAADGENHLEFFGLPLLPVGADSISSVALFNGDPAEPVHLDIPSHFRRPPEMGFDTKAPLV